MHEFTACYERQSTQCSLMSRTTSSSSFLHSYEHHWLGRKDTYMEGRKRSGWRDYYHTVVSVNHKHLLQGCHAVSVSTATPLPPLTFVGGQCCRHADT